MHSQSNSDVSGDVPEAVAVVSAQDLARGCHNSTEGLTEGTTAPTREVHHRSQTGVGDTASLLPICVLASELAGWLKPVGTPCKHSAWGDDGEPPRLTDDPPPDRAVEAAFEAMTEGILIYESAGHISHVNAAARHLLGLDAVGRISRTYQIGTTARYAQVCGEGGQWSGLTVSALLQVLRTTTIQSSTVEIRITPEDGFDRQISAHGAAIHDAGGSVTGGVVVLQDLAERTRLEQELTTRIGQFHEVNRQVGQLRAAFELVADKAITGAVVMFDHSERIIQINARARKLLDLAHLSDHTLIPLCECLQVSGVRDERGLVVNAEQSLTQRILRGEVFARSRAIDAVLRIQTGRDVPLTITGAPMRDGDGQIIGGVLALRPAKGHRRWARGTHEARQSSPMEWHTAVAGDGALDGRRKDEFFAMAAHELRNATTVLHGYASMLSARTVHGNRSKLAKWQTEAIETLAQTAGHLATLADDFIDIARAQAGQLELRCHEADLVTLTQRVARRLQATTGRHRIVFSSTASSVLARIDMRRMEQVLTNLIGNAIKYSPDGGEIGVVLYQSRANGTAIVSVCDHGIGIPQHQSDQIFQRFGRADNARKLGIDGTGLGLYLSNQIVKQHGGHVWFTSSAPPKGEHVTTFYLSLPLLTDGHDGREC